jgi:hypothetical protein
MLRNPPNVNNKVSFYFIPGNINIKNTIQSVPGGKVNILGGHSITHSKQEYVYVCVSYSERFPR